jgi:hypothetical protein
MAGQWGTSVAVDAAEGDERAAAEVRKLAAEFEPRVDDIATSYHTLMLELLAILDAGANE